MIRIVIYGLVASACGRDVYLGERVPPPDSPGDAVLGNGNPFSAGAYTVQFLDPLHTTCTGALGGHEPDFAGVTRASLAVIDGPVTLATPDRASLAIAGASISNRFGVSSVLLIPDTMDPLWSTSFSGSYDAGPDATICQAIALAVDPSTATTTAGIAGVIAFLFVTSDSSGRCSADFEALFTKS